MSLSSQTTVWLVRYITQVCDYFITHHDKGYKRHKSIKNSIMIRYN